MRSTEPSSDSPTTVINPAKGWIAVDWRELWAYRELIYFLTWRDMKVRYRQTLLGASWALAQPLVMTGVFTIVFVEIAEVNTLGIPGPLFSLAGLVPWGLFRSTMVASSDSLLSSSNLISKIYFPRLIAPIAASGAYVVDFVIGSVLLIGVTFYYGFVPGLRAFWLIPLTLLAYLSGLGLGVWFAALNVRYRDMRFIVPFLVQILLFASPIGYSSVEVTGGARVLYALNPLVVVTDGYRWALLGADTRPGPIVAVSCATTLAILVSGLYYFKRVERTFADVI